MKHFHEQMTKRHNYKLGHRVTRLSLHAAGLVRPAPKRSAHRRQRPRRALPGMMLHQDASRFARLPGQVGRYDLVVTLDDATSAIYSAFLVAEEGTLSSFRGIAEGIDRHGLFCELYTDRGNHYFDIPNAGEAVSKTVRTQVGRALAQLGIRHIAAYSPEARGRSERAFRTLQDRLPKELASAGIVTIEAANRWQKRFRRASCASRKSAGSATTTPSNGVGCLCKSRRAHCEPISCARWRAYTSIPRGSWRSSMVHTAWPNTDPMDHRVMMPNWPRDPLRRPPGQPPQKRSIDALRRPVNLTRQQQDHSGSPRSI